MAKMVDLRVYDIDELVGAEADAHELAEVLRALFTDASVSRHRAPVSGRADSDAGAARPSLRTARSADSSFEVLPYRNLLIVQASQHDHEALAQLLEQIKGKLKSGK
jgi:type II secretory pathway component GspD/PulD (secretin)